MIPLFKVAINPDIDEYLLETIHSGFTGEGPRTLEFEQALSSRFNNPNCAVLSAGTHGLTLALRIAGIGPGDQVITSAMTCFATNTPILISGADIVWADVKKEDMNIDPNSIKEKITKRTKAVMVIHWGGYPVDLEEISKICRENNLFLIEDAAHAFGSSYKESIIGDCNFSNFCMMSFQSIKFLSTGDGGALFTKNPEDCERARLLRWFSINRYGSRKDLRCEEDILEPGYKFQMNDIAATIGLSNLKIVDENLRIARDNALFYREKLKTILGVTLLESKTDRQSSNWLFTILVEDRTGFARKMGEKGIMVSQVHARNDKHSCVSKYQTDLSNLEYISQHHISIPVGWWINKEERNYIVESIKEGW